MGKLGEAVVEIYPDSRGLDSGLAQAERQVGGFVGTAKGMVGGLALTAGALGLSGVAAALVGAAKKASDLGESQSKAQAVFGASAKKIEAYADDMAARFGIVKQESIDAASAIGLVGQASGLSGDAAADLGTDMSKLAADLGSMHNVPFIEALGAIRSGLVGESEPLRRFGILLNEDAVKAEALKLGLVGVGKELSEQAKVRARVSLIKNAPAAKIASGDLERTAGSASNQLRKMEGDIENFKVKFGESLIGPMVEAIKLAGDLGRAMGMVGNGGESTAGEWAQNWIAAVRLVGAAHDAEKRKQGLQGMADQQAGVLTLKGSTIDAEGNMLSGDETERKRQMKERREAAEKKAAGAEATRRARMTAGERAAEDRRNADRAERKLYDAGQDAAAPKRGPSLRGAGSDAANAAAEERRNAHRGRYSFESYQADRERSGKTAAEYDAARRKTGLAPEAYAYQQKKAGAKQDAKEDKARENAATGRGLGELARQFAEQAIHAAQNAPGIASRDRAAGLTGQAALQGATGPLGPLSGAAGRLLLGGLLGARGVAEGAEKSREQRARMGGSQTMGGDDFARNNINQAFDAERDKQLAAQEKGNEFLGRTVDLLGRILAKGGDGGRAVLRGKS